jgi:methylated-DNA-[protein]-cysteine S-methyltransferase
MNNGNGQACAMETAILTGRMLPGMSLQQKVWAMTSRIPRGGVATYGQIAAALGTQGYRAVGMALNRNPYAPRVPCHRVVGHDGRLTGFAHGVEAKEKLLRDEGVPFRGGRVDLSCRAVL